MSSARYYQTVRCFWEFRKNKVQGSLEYLITDRADDFARDAVNDEVFYTNAKDNVSDFGDFTEIADALTLPVIPSGETKRR